MKLTDFVSGILKNSTAVSFSEKITTRKFKKVDQTQQGTISTFLLFIDFSDKNFVRGADFFGILEEF